MTEFIQCPTCLGEGQIYDGHDMKQCLDCKGSGELEVYLDEDFDEDFSEEEALNDIDLLLNDPRIVSFDENQHTPLNDQTNDGQ